MPKKNKTRKQKILSDLRRKTSEDIKPTEVINKISESKVESKAILNQDQQRVKQSITTSSYKYVYSDLLRTFILTAAIISGELLLGYFLWR